MGSAPSALLTFTLYQRNKPPVTWPCFAIAQGGSAFHSATIRTISPFGAGSESDVLISGLTLQLIPKVGNFISVHCTFAGCHPIAAELRAHVTGGKLQQAVGWESWSRAFAGPNGPCVLLIECKEAQLDESDVQALLSTAQ